MAFHKLRIRFQHNIGNPQVYSYLHSPSTSYHLRLEKYQVGSRLGRIQQSPNHYLHPWLQIPSHQLEQTGRKLHRSSISISPYVILTTGLLSWFFLFFIGKGSGFSNSATYMHTAWAMMDAGLCFSPVLTVFLSYHHIHKIIKMFRAFSFCTDWMKSTVSLAEFISANISHSFSKFSRLHICLNILHLKNRWPPILVVPSTNQTRGLDLHLSQQQIIL